MPMGFKLVACLKWECKEVSGEGGYFISVLYDLKLKPWKSSSVKLTAYKIQWKQRWSAIFLVDNPRESNSIIWFQALEVKLKSVETIWLVH